MQHPKHCYEMLLDHAASSAHCQRLLIGLVWTICQADENTQPGFSMSPSQPTRTLPWSGTLQSRPIKELTEWIFSWNPYEASIGLAAVNSVINNRSIPNTVYLNPGKNANLGVFDYFLPQLLNQKVVVIGHYPGIENYLPHMQLSVLEKQPIGIDLPDTASEYLLADADWVFITASSLANKSFPRLAELASNATSVLMGPSLPWLPQWHEFGINYLAGVEVLDNQQLWSCIAEGGGVRIFEQSLAYRIAELSPETSMNWLKDSIQECFLNKSKLTKDMELWYSHSNNQRFPGYSDLENLNKRLSRLDSSFKTLWDIYA